MNLAGKFIIQGLVDRHTHSRPWCGELYLNHGVTSIFILNPWGTNGNTLESVRASQQSVRSPRIFGNADRFPLSPTTTRDQINDQFREWLPKKPDFGVLPSYNERNKQAYDLLPRRCEAGLFVCGHTENAPASVQAGQDGVEHSWDYTQALMIPQELENFDYYFTYGITSTILSPRLFSAVIWIEWLFRNSSASSRAATVSK